MKIFFNPETRQNTALTEIEDISRAIENGWKETIIVESSLPENTTDTQENPVIVFHTKVTEYLQTQGFLDIADVHLAALLGEDVNHVLEALRDLRDERNQALKEMNHADGSGE